MILTTPEELRLYLPTHVADSLESLNGFIDNSEHDFLLEKIGQPLYARLQEEYDKLEDKSVLIDGTDRDNAWVQLIGLCQRPVAFDMLYRAADVSAVSMNESGLNILGTGEYDAADGEMIDRYKRRLNMEAHRGIDRLLTILEEWAEDVASPMADEGLVEHYRQLEEIIGLWKKSRYFYLAEGLFINTARRFNELVDIYDSREKFIQLLPDLRYCQEFILRPEIGDALTDDLLEKSKMLPSANPDEEQAIRLARYALALHTEARSNLFSRAEAKDEALGAVRRLVDYLKNHQDKLNPEAVKSSPFYVEKKRESAVSETAEETKAPRWKNNRKGNKLFVTRSIE